MRILIIFIAIFVTFVKSSCVIQSTQIEVLKEMMKGPSMDISENMWSLRYLNYESVVYAISVSDGILFSNNTGDQILFDGWMIRNIQGLGRYHLAIEVDESDNVRTFKKGNVRMRTHYCNQWNSEKNAGSIRYFQSCSGVQSYQNAILVGDTGDIEMISQIVDERYIALTLTKLK